jgi:hypothetical protein
VAGALITDVAFRFFSKPNRTSIQQIVTSHSDNKLTAVLAGAGAVEGAWEPILKALRSFHDFPLTPDGANSYLARLVYLLRWFATSPGEHAQKQLNCLQETLRTVKSNIIDELRKAEKRGEIRARPSLKLLIQQLLIPYSPDFMLVTTNWDKVIDNAFVEILHRDYVGRIRAIHLHGSVAKLSTMYLPSEMTKEPYRRAKDEQSIGSIHGTVWKGLEKANRVIIYGLAIDPLDAELGQILAVGWSNSCLEEILIVDPNHEVIAHRVNLLLDRRRDVRVLSLNPSTLEEEKDYTIWRHRKTTP